MSDNRRRTREEEELRRRRREKRLREERRRKKRRKAILLRIACVAVLVLIIFGIVSGMRGCSKRSKEREAQLKVQQEEERRKEEEKKMQGRDILSQAEQMATQYDYDGAIKMIKGIEGYEDDTSLTARIKAFEKDKAGMTAYDVEQVEHIFFRSLIVDQELADSSEDEAVQTANQNTMTVDAFNQTLQQMYEDGYVLVSLRDLVKVSKGDKGDGSFEKGELMLPSGKKPFVLSQEDVSYPLTLSSTGRGSRIVIGEDGKLAVEYQQADGNVVTGGYDVVPCLDTFIEQHPDFSYRGAKGILGLTGYNGILGYRTDEDLAKSSEEGNKYADYGPFDTDAEIESAKTVIQALKDDGWEFASNGYSGMSYASTLDRVQADAQKWSDRVGSLIGGSDILLYPGGTDIGSWTDYSKDDQKYEYLKSMGFDFFCNIDNANEYWLQIRNDYVRQARKEPDTSQEAQSGEGQDNTGADDTGPDDTGPDDAGQDDAQGEDTQSED